MNRGPRHRAPEPWRRRGRRKAPDREARAVRLPPAGVPRRGAGGPGRRRRTPRCWPAGRAWCRCCRCGSPRRRRSSTSTGCPDLDHVDGHRRRRPGRCAGPARRRAGRRRRRAGCSRCSRWRWRTSRTRRSATAAPRSARSCTPTRPRRCRSVLALLGGSVDGRRRRAGAARSPADDLFVGPLESSLAPRRARASRRSSRPSRPAPGVAFAEIARRHGDYALCGVAAVVTRRRRRSSARAGYLSVSDVPTVVVDLAAASPTPRRRRATPRSTQLEPGRRHPRHRRLPRPPGPGADRAGWCGRRTTTRSRRTA